MRKLIAAAFAAASLLTIATAANAQAYIVDGPVYCPYGYYFYYIDVYGRLWCF